MFQGIFPAMPTPFSRDGLEVMTDAIPALSHALLDEGADGLFVCGTTGEGPLLSAEEKITVIEVTVNAVKNRAPVIAQIGCGDFSGTIMLAKRAKTLGVKAVSVLQPWFFQYDDEAQFNYLSLIAKELGDFPMFLYNLPLFTHTPIQPETVERLLNQHKNICGIKESGGIEALEHWKRLSSDRFQAVCGTDPKIYEFLHRLEGNMIVSSIANLATIWYREMFDAASAGQWDKAKECQDRIDSFISSVVNPNLNAAIKEGLSMKGIEAGYARPPLRNLSANEIMDLKTKLKNLNLL